MPVPDMPAAALEKIQSQDLKRDAAQAGSQPHTVIVELDIPMGKIEAAIPKSRTYPGPPKLSIAPPPTSPDEIERRVSETATAIERSRARRPKPSSRRQAASSSSPTASNCEASRRSPGSPPSGRTRAGAGGDDTPNPVIPGRAQGASPEPMNADAS